MTLDAAVPDFETVAMMFEEIEPMIAEVISIGDELTCGQRLDTNSQWLAERLGELGVRVMFHTTVGDDLAANVRVFREAIDRADIIVVSGGLGPTADDLTRQALANTIGVPLVQDDAALAHIESLFAKRKRPMPPANVIQAQFPKGSRVVPNPHGSAPGIDLTIERGGRSPSRAFCLPGVPAEMKEMWSGTVACAIAAMQPEPRLIHHKRIKCFGVGESDLEAMLPDLIARDREPLVGITVSKATITLRVTASGPTVAACEEAMQPTIDTIHACLGDLIFGYENDELEHSVARLLVAKQKTLATLEGVTGGLIATWLNNVPEIHSLYRGGAMLHQMTKLSDDAIDSLFGTVDYVLWVSDVGADNMVSVGVRDARGWKSQPTPYAGHPDILKARVAKGGLNMLRLMLPVVSST